MTTPPPTSTFLHSPKLSLLFLSSFLITLLLLYQLNSTQTHPFSNPTYTSLGLGSITQELQSKLRDSVTFLPLKDLRFARSPSTGHTWFMSSLEDDWGTPGQPAHILLPSPASKDRLLCLSARNRSDGSSNLYALAFPGALPRNATLLGGLTFVSDTYYDHDNLWHGQSSLIPFVAWAESSGCARPDRWVLFHWGELRSGMGNWVRTLAEATIGNGVRAEQLDRYGDGPVCFERAVVCRHNEGGLTQERKGEVYDMMRCKAREHCNITTTTTTTRPRSSIRLTLLFRVGARAFKNETEVAEIFGGECRKVEGCAMRIERTNNLTFCDQVKLMAETDILATPHGAQLTNMLFMDKNSSVLEFFPKGFQELAGVGQHVYQWEAGMAGMRHQGQWQDRDGEKCPYDNNADCFSFYKDGKVGHDKDYFAKWMASVLKEVKELKLSQASQNSTEEAQGSPSPCPCN
ncbi:uncharacterized protein M6B38_151550 [Iris pallida]|uniref:Glycosyltransferase 61 catalytic domain-containing protein n=2 Tax=Iris pallida TaxID=29817 RepID=A0AAX6F6K7_IRIPA|nr:uncharacterized protein M6B38_151550 [Iris pallida]